MDTTHTDQENDGFMKRMLDVVEKAGNKVPHPVMIFLFLIVAVFILSHILHFAGASVTQQSVDPQTEKLVSTTVVARSLLTTGGIRFIYTSVIPNFMNFTAVGLIIVAMIGVGVAEASGLIKALIRKLVAVSPSWAIAYILVFVGIMSSIAADAGYLVLIPLAGVVFAQKYEPKAGVGTIIALMIPYVVAIYVVWTLLFVVWFLLGLPWGL